MPEGARGGILLDPVDLRDRHYEPTLASLAPQKLPEEALLKCLRDSHANWLPRSQGDEGTCGGQALATLIDIQRILTQVPVASPVSARMIYWAARLTTEGRATGDGTARGAGTDEGVSLREVIKAFYNYGVCSNDRWPYVPNDGKGEIDVERAKEARQVSLGAYYRLRPNLNTYHAALHETGGLLVSAELHDGWLPDQVRDGEIVPPGPNAGVGALGLEKHAFVIVGYTPRGFLVLNSWGRDWGGWRPEAERPDEVPEPVPGIALWRYEDWANTIMDGWVLRLGVGAAEAFEFSIGDQGLGFGVEGAVRSTPVHAILGNFLHLDDGRYVGQGAYISTRRTLSETKRLLVEDAGKPKPEYQGALLTFAGGLLGLKEAAENIARWKRLVRNARWYPFTVLFCVDSIDGAKALLDGIFREAEARAGTPGPRLDGIIEDRAHGVGRALWRDIIHGAEAAARPDGAFHDLVKAAAELVACRPGFGLRIVAESEGAFALTALVRALLTDPFHAEAEPFFGMLQSVDLIAPPLTHEEYSVLAGYLDEGWGRQRLDRCIRLHLPTACDERMLCVSPYGRSYFELVRRTFQGRETVPPTLPAVECNPRARTAIAGKWDPWKQAPRTTLVPISWPRDQVPTTSPRPISQVQLIYRSDVGGRLNGILRRRAPTRRPGGPGV